MSAADEPVVDVDGEEPAPKRGRGRPKGSKTKPSSSRASSSSEPREEPRRKPAPWEPPTRQEVAEAQFALAGAMVVAQAAGGEKWVKATAMHSEALVEAFVRLSRAYDIELSEQSQAWIALGGALAAVATDAGFFEELRQKMSQTTHAPPPPPDAPSEPIHATA
jgi:hypothetical protein